MKKIIFAVILTILLPSITFAKGYYFHEDYLGGSSVVTDEEGNVAATYEYMPYGELYEENIYDEDFSNSYKFTGQEEDTETGLYYYGARYYGAGVGRFMSKDPAVYDERLFENLEDPQSLNAYAYVRNNPVKYTDPRGEATYNVTSYFTSIMRYSARDTKWMKDMKTGWKLLGFASYVKTGAPGDIKNGTFSGVSYTMDSVMIGNNEYTTDVLGNVLFGYIGTSIGLDKTTLCGGAGLYEVIQAVTSGSINIDWKHFYSFFDDPKDQQAIKIGIKLYEQYGDSITEKQIINALKDSGLELEESRADGVNSSCKDEK